MASTTSIQQLLDIPYDLSDPCSPAHPQRTLDLYYSSILHALSVPDEFPSGQLSSAKATLILFVHGGAWRSGDKSEHALAGPPWALHRGLRRRTRGSLWPYRTIDSPLLCNTPRTQRISPPLSHSSSLALTNPSEIGVRGNMDRRTFRRSTYSLFTRPFPSYPFPPIPGDPASRNGHNRPRRNIQPRCPPHLLSIALLPHIHHPSIRAPFPSLPLFARIISGRQPHALRPPLDGGGGAEQLCFALLHSPTDSLVDPTAKPTHHDPRPLPLRIVRFTRTALDSSARDPQGALFPPDLDPRARSEWRGIPGFLRWPGGRDLGPDERWWEARGLQRVIRELERVQGEHDEMLGSEELARWIGDVIWARV